MPNGRDLKHILKRVYNHESLVGVDLRNLFLSFMDFSSLELRRADLGGCCLNHARLNSCDLTGANLRKAKLTHASFDGAKLAGARLDERGRRWRLLRGRHGTDAFDQRLLEVQRSERA